MKILFIIPEIKSMFGTEKGIPIHPHVGIAYLTSVLKQNQNQVNIIDCSLEDNWPQKIKHTIKKFHPDLIGITGFSYAYK